MRALRAARSRRAAKREYAGAQVCLAPDERDEFYWLAYSQDQSVASLLRQFAEAYLNGAPIPVIPGIGHPRNRRDTLTTPDGRIFGVRYGAVRVGFAMPREMNMRLRERAKSQGVSVGAALRRFVLVYVQAHPRPDE
jgi:hypothetical protein